MRFHCAESMTDFSYYVPLARKVEGLGFSGFMIPDSLIYPKASETSYSYTDDGGRGFIEDKAFVESFILATALGSATSTLELTTNVVKLPVRPPLYSAKLAASVAAITGDRFNFGVGLSVWPEDYAAMGVDYGKRGKRFDECIAIVKGLCAGDYFEFHGEFYDLAPIKINPVPTRPLPILIGGHSDAALKRAARHDGFLATGLDAEAMQPLIATIEQHRRDIGATSKPFRHFTTLMGEVTLDDVRRLEDVGVTDIAMVVHDPHVVGPDTQPLQDKLDILDRFADATIGKL